MTLDLEREASQFMDDLRSGRHATRDQMSPESALLALLRRVEEGQRERICRDLGRVPFNNPLKLPSFGRIPWGNDPAVFIYGFREGVAWAGWRVAQDGESRDGGRG